MDSNCLHLSFRRTHDKNHVRAVECDECHQVFPEEAELLAARHDEIRRRTAHLVYVSFDSDDVQSDKAELRRLIAEELNLPSDAFDNVPPGAVFAGGPPGTLFIELASLAAAAAKGAAGVGGAMALKKLIDVVKHKWAEKRKSVGNVTIYGPAGEIVRIVKK